MSEQQQIPPRPGADERLAELVRDIFESMPGRARPEKLAGVTASFGYCITGEQGGEWTVRVRDGAVEVLEGIHDPDVVSTISAEDWVALNTGELDGMTAFSSGRLAVEGKMSLLARSARFFRRYEPPVEEGAQPAEAPAPEEEELVVLRKLISIPQRFATGPLMGRFLRELRDNKRILANRCPSCGRLQAPPREVCAVCRVPVDELVEVGPEGTVTVTEVVHYSSPDPLTGESRETPYCAAFIVLDGCGPNDVFWHEINPAQLDRVRTGVRVRPVWAEERRGAITDIRYFEIIESAGDAGAEDGEAPAPAEEGSDSE
jgi:hypothetical protein